MSRPDPLVDHPYLKRALSPDQYVALTTPGGRLSVPLVQFLPPNLAYQSREQIIATLYPQLATEAGPAPNVKELIDQITDSETLRTFLTPKLRGPVSITVDVDDTVSFFFEGAEIKSEDGMIEPPALDQVSIATIDVIGHEAHQEAVQLADLRFLDAMVTYASEHIAPLAIRVVTDPGELRDEEVRQMAARPLGWPRSPNRSGPVYCLATRTALRGGGRFSRHQERTRIHVVGDLGSHVVRGEPPGSNTSARPTKTPRTSSRPTHWTPGGVLSGMGWGATKVEHFIGNLVTAGHMDRQARNAPAYQEGRIRTTVEGERRLEHRQVARGRRSNRAERRVGLTCGRRHLQCGGRLLHGRRVNDDRHVRRRGEQHNRRGRGDAFSKVAAATTGDRYVRDFQNESLVGPRRVGS